MIISQNLKRLFLLSIPLFMLHSLEEYITLYYKIDLIIKYHWTFITPLQSSFIAIEAGTWTVMLVSALLIEKKMFPLPLMLFFGTFYTYQSEHMIHTVKLGMYYPGFITGTVLFILGIFFWIAVIKDLGVHPNSSSV